MWSRRSPSRSPPRSVFRRARYFNSCGYADAMNRVGDAEQRLFHFYVHEPLRASGLTPDELAEATAQVSGQLLSLVEPAVLFFHRRGLARAVRDDLVLHVAEDAGLLPPGRRNGPAALRGGLHRPRPLHRADRGDG